MRPGGRTTRRERGVHLHRRGRVEHAEAVGPDEPHARLPADAEQLRLPRLALRAVFAEAGREHHERANTFERACPRGLRDKRRGDGDDGQLDRSGDVCDGCVGSPAGDGLRVRVDRIDRAGERAGDEVADDRPPTLTRRREAPITAIEAGSRTWRTAATAAIRSRSSKWSIASCPSWDGSSISSTPGSERTSMGKPESRNT